MTSEISNPNPSPTAGLPAPEVGPTRPSPAADAAARWVTARSQQFEAALDRAGAGAARSAPTPLPAPTPARPAALTDQWSGPDRAPAPRHPDPADRPASGARPASVGPRPEPADRRGGLDQAHRPARSGRAATGAADDTSRPDRSGDDTAPTRRSAADNRARTAPRRGTHARPSAGPAGPRPSGAADAQDPDDIDDAVDDATGTDAPGGTHTSGAGPGDGTGTPDATAPSTDPVYSPTV